MDVARFGLGLLGAGSLDKTAMRRRGARTSSDYRWRGSLHTALDLRVIVSARRVRRLSPRTYESFFYFEAVAVFRAEGALGDNLAGALHTWTLGR